MHSTGAYIPDRTKPERKACPPAPAQLRGPSSRAALLLLGYLAFSFPKPLSLSPPPFLAGPACGFPEGTGLTRVRRVPGRPDPPLDMPRSVTPKQRPWGLSRLPRGLQRASGTCPVALGQALGERRARGLGASVVGEPGSLGEASQEEYSPQAPRNPRLWLRPSERDGVDQPASTGAKTLVQRRPWGSWDMPLPADGHVILGQGPTPCQQVPPRQLFILEAESLREGRVTVFKYTAVAFLPSRFVCAPGEQAILPSRPFIYVEENRQAGCPFPAKQIRPGGGARWGGC